MRALPRRGEQGQAAVETALTLPMMLFALLGILQLTLTYHARILTEYAAYKAVRAGSVYRADCKRMQQAALMALIPSMPAAQGSPQQQFVRTALAVTTVRFNKSTKWTPLVFIDYQIENMHAGQPFDLQLEPGSRDVLRLRVRLAYFFEYRIPFANWIMTKYWLAVNTGRRWAQYDPTMVMSRAKQPTPVAIHLDELTTHAQAAIARNYYTTPIVATWSMRMMSDTMPNERGNGRCR
jgi:Flp pilus assembly protein TadG